MPSWAIRAACVPPSTIRPWSSTSTRSPSPLLLTRPPTPNHGPPETAKLPLPDRQAPAAFADSSLEALRQSLEQVQTSQITGSLGDLEIGRLGTTHANVFENGPREQKIVLQDDSHLVMQRIGI